MVVMMRRGPLFEYDVYFGECLHSTHIHVANNTSMGTIVLSCEDGLYVNRQVYNRLLKPHLCMQMFEIGKPHDM